MQLSHVGQWECLESKEAGPQQQQEAGSGCIVCVNVDTAVKDLTAPTGLDAECS